MPIIKAGDPHFAGFDPNQAFTSDLHDEHILSGGAVSKFFRDLTADTSVYNQFQNFSRMARHGIANIAMTSGLPQQRLEALGEVFGEAPRIGIEAITKIVSGDPLGGALLLFDEALGMVATKVPVVGWVVKIGLFFYEAIKAAINTAKLNEGTEAVQHAIAYARSTDETLIRQMLPVLKDRDWTSLFLPQFRPERICTSKLAYTNRGMAGGFSWEVCSEDPWGWGLTPGLSSRFTGAVGVFQSPRKAPGSSRDAGEGSITGYGEMVPSSVQFGMTAWQMVLKNTPNAFAIDGDAIISAWDDYYGLLDQYRMHTDDQWVADQVERSTTYWNRQYEQTRVEGYDPDKLPAKYERGSFLYCDLIRYIVAEVWKARLPRYLETLTVAYVPYGAPALRGGGRATPLSIKHHQMRQLLLEHPARMLVEVDLIPDEAYRRAMAKAQLRLDPVFTSRPQPNTYHLIDHVPVLDTGTPLPPEPETDPAPGLPPPTPPAPPAASGTGLAAIGIVGAAGLMWALRRRRRR